MSVPNLAVIHGHIVISPEPMESPTPAAPGPESFQKLWPRCGRSASRRGGTRSITPSFVGPSEVELNPRAFDFGDGRALRGQDRIHQLPEPASQPLAQARDHLRVLL